MELKLGNSIYTVDDNMDLYNKYRQYYRQAAIEASKKYCDTYLEISNIEKAMDALISLYSETADKLVKYACKTLFEYGIYDVSTDVFTEKYYDDYFNIESEIEPVCKELYEIARYADELQGNLEKLQSSRGYWEGGGFGLKGAIKGAVTAGALNMASGAVHGIGDFFRSISNDSKVQKRKEQLYNDDETHQLLCDAIYTSCYGIFGGLYEELIVHGVLTDVSFKTKEAMAMFDNAQQFIDDETERNIFFVKCICMDPYESDFYMPFFGKKDKPEGFYEFAKYFGVSDEILLDNFTWTKRSLKKVAEISDSTCECRWTKLDLLFTVERKNRKLTQPHIEKLIELIIKKDGASVEKIDESLNYINSNISNDLSQEQLETVNHIIELLNEKKREYQKKSEYNKICNASAYSTDEAISKINRLIQYSKTYSTDETEKIKEIMLSIALGRSKSKTIEADISKIKQIEIGQYEFVDEIVSALEIKKKIFEYQEKCAYDYLPYIFSPVILDVISQAREGNPLCQLWLIKLLCDNIVIDHLKESAQASNLSRTEKDSFEKICGFISDVICYLFDKPSIYSFDLYMRLRFNSIYCEDEDYFESLEVFKDDEKCLAGVFEYGLLQCRFTDKQEGEKSIEKAALLGYMDAIKYMHKQKIAEDSTDIKKLFYRILADNDSKFKTLYNANSSKHEDRALTTIKSLSRVINNSSLALNGCDCISDLIYDVWNDYYSSDFPNWYNKFGYPNGDFTERMLIKASHLMFKSEAAENFYFAAQTKDSSHTVLITNKNIRWKDSCGDIHCKSFNSDIKKDTNLIFRTNGLEDCVLQECYIVAYFACKDYSSNLPVETLEKMAFCGHPLAICNLLVNKDYSLSDDKKDVWLKQKGLWESKGKHYSVCPNCYNETTKDDLFCPECGNKLN